MNLHQQNELLKKIIRELTAVGIPISGVYIATDETDGGIEIDNQYVLQIAPYHDPIFVLDVVESPGEAIACFATPSELIQFVMET